MASDIAGDHKVPDRMKPSLGELYYNNNAGIDNREKSTVADPIR